MKPSVSRWVCVLSMCCLIAAALVGCKGKEENAKPEQTGQPNDVSFDFRQAKMKEISAICGGINKMLVKSGRVDNVAADAKKLQGIMVEVEKIPPPVDAEKYAFYAADFQKRADVLAVAADQGTVDQTKAKFIELTQTCGVCHYTCKYPTD